MRVPPPKSPCTASSLDVSSEGFTLLEILLVVTVIAVLAGITLGALGGVQQKAARDRTSAEVAAIANALERFRMQNDTYPKAGSGDTLPVKSIESFMELKPESVNKEGLLDPYGNPYRYAAPGTRNIATFDLWSGGASSSTNDDIGNW